MTTRPTNAYQTIIIQVVFGFVFLGLALYGVKSAIDGSTTMLLMLGCLIALAVAMLALDDCYWVLLPLLSGLDLTIPGVRFNGWEQGMLVVVLIHALRLVLNRDSALHVNGTVLVVFPLILWVAFVFCMNPVGLALFGSAKIGGRFYFDIFLAFFAFLAIASLRLSEKDAKLFFRVLVATSLFQIVTSIAQSAFGSVGTAGSFGLPDEDVGTRYYLIPLGAFYIILLSRWSLSEILTRPSLLVGLMISVAASIFSGKRQSFGYLLVTPLLRVLLTGREKTIAFVGAALGAVVIMVTVAGDGAFYELPRSAKRSLALVVPSYSSHLDDGGMSDRFRHEVRQYGYDLIRQHPWVGRKGFAQNLDETVWHYFGGSRLTNMFEGHAEAGNWHNMYLAYACDFGLPCLFYVLFMLGFAGNVTFRNCRRVAKDFSAERPYTLALLLYFSIYFVGAILFGWWSGHASESTMTFLIRYGWTLALLRGLSNDSGMTALKGT